MRLFAIVSQVHSVEELSVSRGVVEEYLKLIVRKDKIRQYLIMYDFYHNSLREREMRTGDKQLSLFSVKAVIICEQINKELDKKQKVFILTHILEVLSTTKRTTDEIDFVKTIALAFRLDENIFFDCLAFVFDDIDNILQKNHVLVVDSSSPSGNFKHLFRDFLSGRIVFFYIEQADICFFRHIQNDDQLYYNDQKIEIQNTYTFEEGSQIKSPLMGTIFYNDVLKVFLHNPSQQKVQFVADRVSYIFPNSTTGIQPFSFSEESGQLLGVMGNSGVGKSTLLNLLNGNLKPNTGRLLVNGYDLIDNSEQIHGIIGFIPQDDMLIEELTVFQNLYYSARLCFRDLSKAEIIIRVTGIIEDLGLSEARNLKVGNPLNKFISGGQRKRLNIALELIREPNILFVDEPTSGLSSNDSEMVMELLKRQSLKGKLVVVNIHQPSSDIFKKFDKLLLIDAGGRVVFQGNPLNSLVYLKSFKQLLNADEGECSNCGNINPEQILQIIEAKTVNEYGEYTSERQVFAEEWYENYKKTQEKELNPAIDIRIDLPKIEFKPLSNFNQFKVFGLRNLLSKISDKQYLLINLLEAPVLALILGWFSKYNAGTPDDIHAYVFNLNSNLPVYIFMSVVVAIFLGLMVSAEEIIRDSKILKREAFLHLNRKSYFNSKVFYLSVILALQMALFVLVGNSILEIKGMYLYYWFMLWITSLLAGVVGLNLSATLHSVVAIYILIPILIVPQILLGGAMIPFNKLNSRLTSTEVVPIYGNLMPSRWAYEGLIVWQFSENKYYKELFEIDQKISQASFLQNYLIPEISSLLTEANKEISKKSTGFKLDQKIEQLSHGLETLLEYSSNCENTIELKDSRDFNASLSKKIEQFVQCYKETFNRLVDVALTEKDNKIFELENEVGGLDSLLHYKSIYTNDKLRELVTNVGETQKIIVGDNRLIQLIDPIFKKPATRYGGSHFFSAIKRVGNVNFHSYWYNLSILVLILIVFYVFLLFEIFPRLSKVLNQKSFEWVLTRLWRRFVNIFKPFLK